MREFNESVKNISNHVKQTIKDILLPISDIDYTISVSESPFFDFRGEQIGTELTIRVVTYTDKPLVITDDIKGDFITMKEYLESEGFSSIEARYVRDNIQTIRNREFDTFIKNMDINLLGYSSLPSSRHILSNLLFVAKKIE
jgi:hypothetical protein